MKGAGGGGLLSYAFPCRYVACADVGQTMEACQTPSASSRSLLPLPVLVTPYLLATEPSHAVVDASLSSNLMSLDSLLL